jgi:Histidine kinase-, DNA gyrase B-, and HSP90-like ATPase
MRSQCFHRAILVSELGLREDRVDLLVTTVAKKNYAKPFLASETPLRARASMKTARDEVMPGQMRNGTSTQCAASLFHDPLADLHIFAQSLAQSRTCRYRLSVKSCQTANGPKRVSSGKTSRFARRYCPAVSGAALNQVPFPQHLAASRIRSCYGARSRRGIDCGRSQVSAGSSFPGIPEADRAKVFDPFVRLESSGNRDTDGTGIGLSIARSIIRNHGGDIVLSPENSFGLRVHIRLPETRTHN